MLVGTAGSVKIDATMESESAAADDRSAKAADGDHGGDGGPIQEWNFRHIRERLRGNGVTMPLANPVMVHPHPAIHYSRLAIHPILRGERAIV